MEPCTQAPALDHRRPTAHALPRRLGPRVSSRAPQEIANLLWAVAAMGFYPGGATMAALSHVRRPLRCCCG